MTDFGSDIDLDKIKNNEFSHAALDQEAAHAVMAQMMDYYVKLNKVVRTKISYASDATRKRIDEIENDESIVKRYQKLDQLWNQIIELISVSDMTTDEIEQIGAVVDFIPKSIRNYYDKLVEMDEQLQSLITEIESDEYQALYKEAQQITKVIQKGKNIMSGLDNEKEYKDKEAVKAAKAQKKEVIEAGKDMGMVTLPDGRKVRLLT